MRLDAALLLLCLPVGAAAQAVPSVGVETGVRDRAAALMPLLRGETRGYDDAFDERFRLAVPLPKLAALLASLRETLGVPQAIGSFVSEGPWGAMLTVRYARGTATIRLAVDPAPPHRVTGLLVIGTELRDDSFGRIEADMRALPGSSGYGVYALGERAPVARAGLNTDIAAPIGSAFKLWLLAEAARQVATGKRRWSDIVPTGPRSLPSGILQDWPAGTPVTLQTLATLMIAISDNTAADLLLTTLGRDAVDAGTAADGGATPVLTTREAFAIKGDAALTTAWTQGSASERRALLVREAPRLAAAPLDGRLFANGPVAIGSVEWFASPHAMALTLNRLTRAGPVALDILGIHTGIDPGTRARFAYVGFKGGSEPGVVALDYLVRRRDGRWFAVCGNWHRGDGAVDEQRLVALMTRALTLIAKEVP